jgi:hypothetical protein
MTSVGECKHTHWQSMFDSEGFMYQEVCMSCGKTQMAAVPRKFSEADLNPGFNGDR